MGGFSIGRISGIEIRIDWSLLIVFTLIAVLLGTGVFPAWHPDWSGLLIWVTALAAAVMFFGSVLLHELSHALVARRFGTKVPRITLFVFGGMAEMEDEPKTWKAEFWIAVVGPIASLVIGFVCLVVGGALADVDATPGADPQAVLGELGPVPTLLLWLGPVNIILGLFNLVPGFPLDGGRVLRAAIWGATKNLKTATRWAAGAGQAFAWLLIVSGFAMILGLQVPVFGTGLVGGLWLALIGWFLNNAAIMSYQQLSTQESLGKTSVGQVMQTDLLPVAPDTRLTVFMADYLLHSGQRAFPVTRGNEFLGLVCMEDLRRVKQEEHLRKTVSDIMTPKERITTIESTDDASKAMKILTQTGVNQLPVIDGGQLVGLLTRENILRWLSLEKHLQHYNQ